MALVPDVVKKLVGAGWEVCVQAGAGTEAAFSDSAFTEAGATVAPDAAATLSGAGLVVRVNPPSAEDVAAMPEGAALLSFFGVAQAADALRALAAKKATVFSFDLLPADQPGPGHGRARARRPRCRATGPAWRRPSTWPSSSRCS